MVGAHSVHGTPILAHPGIYFFFAAFFFGTFAPARRASDNPIAIACLRLFTFLPEPPLRSVPSFALCKARFTLLEAFFPYLLAMEISCTG